MLRRPVVLLLLIAAVGAAVWLLFETRRLAERLGTAEREAHLAQQRARSAEQRLAEMAEARSTEADEQAAHATQPPAPAVALDEFARLRLELHTTRTELAQARELLRQRNEELAARAAQAREQNAKWLRPMPEGVRLCLRGLHTCLRDEGYLNQRFLRAESLDDEGLHGVEMIETSDDGLAVAFVTAARMTATVDREIGRFVLRFFDGYRAADGKRLRLPDDGFALTFDDVDGRVFEARLPYLVKGEGSYPVEVVAGVERVPTDLDPGSRRQWLRRINRLLAGARTEFRWRATRLRGLADATFLTVELVATDDKGLVHAGANCQRLAVEVDERTGLVSLLLQDGVLRQPGGESTISAEGHRMLLPGIKPKDTIDALLGMVVKR